MSKTHCLGNQLIKRKEDWKIQSIHQSPNIDMCDTKLRVYIAVYKRNYNSGQHI